MAVSLIPVPLKVAWHFSLVKDVKNVAVVFGVLLLFSYVIRCSPFLLILGLLPLTNFLPVMGHIFLILVLSVNYYCVSSIVNVIV